MARLDKKLNIIIDVEMADGSKGYVHSMPISREVFEQHFLVISKVVTAIYVEGLTTLGGPRIAALLLRQIARDLGVWEGPGGVQEALMAELRRLSNLALSTAAGWTLIPLQEAIDKKLIDDDSLVEMENALVFFIVVSSTFRRNQLIQTLNSMGGLWATRCTQSNATEFVASLRTSTETAISGTSAASSEPT